MKGMPDLSKASGFNATSLCRRLRHTKEDQITYKYQCKIKKMAYNKCVFSLSFVFWMNNKDENKEAEKEENGRNREGKKKSQWEGSTGQ